MEISKKEKKYNLILGLVALLGVIIIVALIGLFALREEPYVIAANLPYYITADAIERLLDRLIAQGERNLKFRAEGEDRKPRLRKQVESLKRLREGPPKTAYDVMQFVYLTFVLCEHFEVIQARSLTTIDKVLWPYYAADLAERRTTEAEFREQFGHFLWQWGSIDNYWGQPITMGGTKADGTTEYNPLSYVILDVMDECALPSPKFHLKIAENTPDAFLRKSFDMARRHRSLSFVGEKPVWRVLEHLGYPPEEARQFVTKGCYEFCVPKDGNGLGGGHPNMVKVVEQMLADAADGKFAAEDFAAFKREYVRRLCATAEEVREFFFTFEKHLDDVNPALVASLAGEYSVQTGKDALANGTRTGNETHLCLSGFGTAIDALRLFHKSVLEKTGGYDENLIAGPEDWELDIRVLATGAKCAVLKNHLIHNEKQLTLKRMLEKKAYYTKSMATYQAKWKDHPALKKQFGLYYRFLGVFIENGKWKKLVRHPILAFVMYFERFAVGLTYLLNR